MLDEEEPFDLGRARRVKSRGLYLSLPLAERVRIARGYQQAIVKVISYARGVKRVGQLMDYIGREGELELEKDTGELIKERDETKALAVNWAADFGDRKNSRDAVHITFSMPRGSDPEALRKAVRAVASKAFEGHEWVFGIHKDRPHPHAHMVVKMRGRDIDKKLRLNKPELYQLRGAFAEAAREQGVMLTASPRAARGVGQKGEKQAVHQMRRRGIIPNIDREAVKEAMMDLRSGKTEEKPWEKKIRERNDRERKAFLENAAALRRAAEQRLNLEERKRLLEEANALERFAKTMTRPKTRSQKLKEKILKKIHERKVEKKQSQDRGMEMER